MPFLVFAAVVPDLYSEQVRTSLRQDAVNVVLGILLSAVGVTSAALYRLRTRTKDPALLWFGLFAGLYGVRLLTSSGVLRFITAPVPSFFWSYAVAAITYLIPLPGICFIYEIFPSWRRALRWLLCLQAAFAAAGLASDQFRHRPGSLSTVNDVLVLCAIMSMLAALFGERQRKSSVRALQAGILVFCLTVFVSNLSSLGLFPLPINPEPLGFTVFLVALGRLIARRTMHNEERLVSLDKELEIARRIQSSILPREMPRTPQIRVAARYLPMTAVAGDFYDFLVVDDDRVGILVADVSGHGVPAALIASMVKVAIAAQLPHAHDPGRVMAGINQTLCGKLQGQFVTAAYLFLDLAAGRARYGAAGHPPLLLWSASAQKVEAIVENGLVLGVTSAATYSAIERRVGRGDRFLLYTDGLLEATNAAGEFFGDERLRKAMEGNTLCAPEEWAKALLDGLSKWAGYDGKRGQEDDLTVVVVDLQMEAGVETTAG